MAGQRMAASLHHGAQGSELWAHDLPNLLIEADKEEGLNLGRIVVAYSVPIRWARVVWRGRHDACADSPLGLKG
jgi:hypothetical protein